MMRNRILAITLSATAALMLACGGSDSTVFEGEGALIDVSRAPEAELGPVRAQLTIEDGELLVLMHNETNYDATVDLNLAVDSPIVHSANDLGQIRMLAGEERREVLSRDGIDGFDLAGSSWLRAELRYRFALDDGQSGLLFTALAARDGAMVPKAEAIEGGYQLADMVLEGERTVEKAVGDPFRVCFTNPLQFAPAGGVPSDSLSPNLSADSGSWPFYGQVLYAHYPANGTSFTVKDLDTSGCVNLTRKLASGSETWRFRMLSYGGVPTSGLTAVAYAIDSAGSTPFLDKTVTIPATTNPGTVSVEFTTTETKNLYTSTFLAVNSLRRVTSQLGLSPPSGYILRISPSTDTVNPGGSFYCRGINSRCPTAMTMRVGNADAARNRGTIAHETGHYVHHWYTSTSSFSYDYTRANSGLPLDNCDFKRNVGFHNQLSIEWQSAAHVEGLADFFRAVTYNRTNQSDCSFEVEGITLDCEAIGKSLRGNGGSTLCGEWNSSAYIDRTGNELDWAKMYWDFLTDYNTGTNFAKYMQAEKNVAASLTPTTSHFAPIRDALFQLDATQGNNFMDSSWGNILDGDSR